MKLAYNIKMSTYRLLIKRGLTIKKMRKRDFRSANFGSANFRYADFGSADFRSADFGSADFRSANFGSANLPNGFYPLSLPGRNWAREIFIVGDTLHIGCQRHLIESWMKFSDAEISNMDDGALRWWGINKPILMAIIEQVKQTWKDLF